MATSVTVLCSNAKRVNIKVTPNTSLLQILEQACSKQNLNAQDFDLVHQRKVLDLSLSLRFANLPNNTQLELRPSQGGRQESTVAVCMQTEGGGRFVHSFSPTSTFWDIITHWVQEIGEESLRSEAIDGAEPVCLYMRKEVVGESKLKETTLRNLGLTSGSAVIRLFYRIPETLKTQAYVESINLKQKIEDNVSNDNCNNQATQRKEELSLGWDDEPKMENEVTQKPSSGWDDDKLVSKTSGTSGNKVVTEDCGDANMELVEDNSPFSQKSEIPHSSESTSSIKVDDSQNMEDDLPDDNEEIIYVGDRDAVLYNARNVSSHTTEIIPDDFFDLTVEDARYLYASLQKQRMELENQMLCTQAFKEAKKMDRMLRFKNTVLRIHFPNQLVLQARFATLEKVSNVTDFVRQFLTDEKMKFELFTSPPKTILDPEHALYEAGLVPAALVHFGCDEKSESILKSNLLEKLSSHKAACKAAKFIRQSSKSDEMLDDTIVNQVTVPPIQSKKELKPDPGQTDYIPSVPSTSSKMPKWFRSGPK